MTPERMAEIYASAFPLSRPWTADEFAEFGVSPLCFFTLQDQAGFALGQVIAGEVELLTIAITPDQQGRGLGSTLLNQFHAHAVERGARESLLEVAEDNASAIRLYQRAGYSESGRRKGYYKRSDSTVCDAILMRCPLL